jgi:hypothetical protein
MIQLAEGKVFMIGSIVGAVLCLAGLITFLALSAKVSDLMITMGGCIAGGLALALLLWDLGFIWDIINAGRWWEQHSVPWATPLSLVPGIGLWMGLAAAIGAIVLIGIVMGSRGRGIWLYLAEGLGLTAGILLLTLNVQPWNAGPGEEEPINLAGPEAREKVKLLKRYEPMTKGTLELFGRPRVPRPRGILR